MLEAIAVPGHTLGMLGMTRVPVRELRALLLGDGCNAFTFLFSPEASNVQEYKSSLQNLLLKHGERFDTVWFSHGHNTGIKTIINECIELSDEIMAGKADNIPFNFMGKTAFIAKAINLIFRVQMENLATLSLTQAIFWVSNESVLRQSEIVKQRSLA